MLGDVLVIGVGELAGEAALLADVQLATSLLVAVRLVHAVQLALVRLERTALSERLVTPTTAVRTNSCTPRQQPALKPSSHRSSHLIELDSDLFKFCSVRMRGSVKCPYIGGYFVASFPYFNGNGTVYVCIRKSTE